jgi:hypothetical protein
MYKYCAFYYVNGVLHRYYFTSHKDVITRAIEELEARRPELPFIAAVPETSKIY